MNQKSCPQTQVNVSQDREVSARSSAPPRRARGKVGVIAGGALFLALATAAWTAPARQPLFESDEILSIRLEAPISTLLRQENEGEEWLPGSLHLKAADGKEQVFEMGVRVRGNFRRTSGSCSFPPFWINLKKSQVEGTVFENQDRLKVVAHCVEKASYHRYVHREYLAYKTFNLITEAGFRVRLAEIEYFDTDGRRKPATHPAFLIEHEDGLADRLGGKVFEGKVVLPEFFDPAALVRANLFEFLIGNTDFSFEVGPDECCHNSKAIVVEHRNGGYLPVPYDFDLSGIVNAPYARPHSSFDIDDVTDRLYRGIQCPPEVMHEAVRLYQDRREAILNLWRNTNLLSERDRHNSVAFIEEFFEVLDSDKAFTREIGKKARSPEALTNHLKRKYPDSIPAGP
jgi:hypothetical protein